MSVSIFDLFKIGIGPSSSHTVGPMIAARQFACHVRSALGLAAVHHVTVELFGSLSATGVGHGTDTAVLLAGRNSTKSPHVCRNWPEAGSAHGNLSRPFATTMRLLKFSRKATMTTADT